MLMKLITVHEYLEANPKVEPHQLQAALVDFLNRRPAGHLWVGELAPTFNTYTSIMHVDLSRPTIVINNQIVHRDPEGTIVSIVGDVTTPQLPSLDLQLIEIKPRIARTPDGLVLVTFDAFDKQETTPRVEPSLSLQIYADYVTAAHRVTDQLLQLKRKAPDDFNLTVLRLLTDIRGTGAAATWNDVRCSLPMGMDDRLVLMIGHAEYHFYDNIKANPDGLNVTGVLQFVTSNNSGLFYPNPLHLPELTRQLNLFLTELIQLLETPEKIEAALRTKQERANTTSRTLNALQGYVSEFSRELTLAELDVLNRAVKIINPENKS